MSKATEPLTLRQFVKAKFPDNWAVYEQATHKLLIKPGQAKAPASDQLIQYFLPEAREASAKAWSAYDVIAKQLKDVLPNFVVVADDANHKSVVLERRHWADAVFELENSAIRHGDQRWTNVEVQVRPSTPLARPPARLAPQARRREEIDDAEHVAEFFRQLERNPDLTVHAFVLEHAEKIAGASREAKIRRMQERGSEAT